MKYRIDDHIVFRQPPAGPLTPWLCGVAQSLRDLQYRSASIYRYLRRIAQFSEWLELQQVELSQLRETHFNCFLRTVKSSAYSEVQVSLRHLRNHFQCAGVIDIQPQAAPLSTPVERCISEYRTYLLAHRNLTEKTIRRYTRTAHNFLTDRFGDGPVELCQLQAEDVFSFVRGEAGRLSNPSTVKNSTGAVRNFLRYVHLHAQGMPDLTDQVPAVASWAMTSVPRAIQSDQAEKLLSSIDRSTPLGLRDYAILLIIVRLGLRVSEVAFLQLSDIDWHAATLTVRLKGGKCGVYPLTEQVGEAIAEYLQHGRAPSDDPRVFLRWLAPNSGFQRASSIGAVIGRHIERAGIEAPTREVVISSGTVLRPRCCSKALQLIKLAIGLATGTRIQPESMPRSMWNACELWLLPGREVRHEHDSPRHPQISGTAACARIQTEKL